MAQTNKHFLTRMLQRRTSKDVVSSNLDNGFLPNFCVGGSIVNVVVLAEMIALAITVLTDRISANIYQDFILISLFVQWVALTSIAVLCVLRRLLNRLPPWRAIFMAYLILLCITWVVSELAIWILAWTGLITTPRPSWYLYFHVQNIVVSGVVNALALRYFLARDQLREKTLAAAAAHAEVQKHRVRRHFLFNSMNSIASLTQRSPTKAEEAIEDMSDLFRLMLDESKGLIAVHKEIALAKKYVKMEKLRFQRRLKVSWSVGEIPRFALTPTLLLQQLLEDAIHGGIEASLTGGEIHVKVSVQGDKIEYALDSPWSAEEQHHRNPSELIEHIRACLQEEYQENAEIRVNKSGERQSVVVRHPISVEI